MCVHVTFKNYLFRFLYMLGYVSNIVCNYIETQYYLS